jgi:hypothetical protein
VFFVDKKTPIVPSVYYSPDNLQNGKTAELNEAGWKYHTGDDGVWAKTAR